MNILGIEIDETLSFKPHVDNGCRRAASSLYALKILRSKGLEGVDLEIKRKQAEAKINAIRKENEIKLERQKLEMEIKKRELESKIEREKQELLAKTKQHKLDMEIKRKEIEMKEKQIITNQEHEIRLESIRQQGQNDRHTNNQTSSNTSIGYNGMERIEISTLESQNINDVDNFLEKFERLAIMSDVPKKEWGRILTSKLGSQFDRVINAIPYEVMKDYEIIVGELRKQFALDSTYYRNVFQELTQFKGESTMSFFNRSKAALFKWLASENLEIDSSAHQQVRDILDFIIRDNYMSKITTFREKIMYIKQNKTKSLQQLAEVADIFDKSYTEPYYEWQEPQQDIHINSNKTFDTNKRLGDIHFEEMFNPEESRYGDWRNDNSNHNNRNHEQKQNQNRIYDIRAINALALDSRSNRQNMRCNHCSRTNHLDNECYYKPGTIQNNSRSKQDGQIRNQRNQNNWRPRRNENVRCMEDQEIEEDCEQPGNVGITFNRESDFRTNNGNNQKETRVMKENEESNWRQHNVYATFIEGIPDSYKESTGYGIINGIPSKVIRDTGASCSFINSKLVRKEDYTGENVTVMLAEGKSQSKPLAIVPVRTPFFIGRLTCIVKKRG